MTDVSDPSRHSEQRVTVDGRFPSALDDFSYLRRLLITLLAVGLAYFLWQISGILLLVFATIILAILLRSIAGLIEAHSPIPANWALTAAIVCVAGAIVGIGLLFGRQITGQIAEVGNRLPQAIDAAGQILGISDASSKLTEAAMSGAGPSIVSRLAGFGVSALGMLADVALVLVAALYVASDPKLYRAGLAKLFPKEHHARIYDAMDATGNALTLWLAGQFITMALVATISGLAYWWIGLPSPIALGAIAGVTNFIPFLGPVLGGIPAVLIALAIGKNTLLWTLGAAFLIQQIEGNLITPMIQKRAASLPPALVLFAIVIFGLLFGLAGVFLAVPLTLTILVLVKKLWIRQALGEPTAVPGERDAREGSNEGL